MTTVEPTTERPTPGNGDHDRMAHYVDKDDAARAYVTGDPIRALCGKVWTPNRDPDRYPICPTCLEVLAALRR